MSALGLDNVNAVRLEEGKDGAVTFVRALPPPVPPKLSPQPCPGLAFWNLFKSTLFPYLCVCLSSLQSLQGILSLIENTTYHFFFYIFL